MTGPDHHAEMEAHCAAARERADEDHLREITRWLADQMCRAEEPLIGQFANSLSVEGAKRLNGLMHTSEAGFSGAGLKGIRGGRADLDLVQHWQNEAIRAEYLAGRLKLWLNEAQRLAALVRSLGGDPELPSDPA